jgi:hypothetical protein
MDKSENHFKMRPTDMNAANEPVIFVKTPESLPASSLKSLDEGPILF